MARRLLGWSILAALFAATCVIMADVMGWLATVATLVGAGVVTALIAWAAYLITEPRSDG